MKKRILAATAVFVFLTIIFSGCAATTAVGNFVGQLTNGIPMSDVYHYEIGDIVETLWLNFRVDSVQFAEEFNGNVADSGKQFLLVKVMEKNTYEGPTFLYWDDYFIDGVGIDSYQYPIINEDNEDGDLPYDGMRPDSYEMAEDESNHWILPFEVPDTMTAFIFTYYEPYGESSRDVNEYMIAFDMTDL